MQSTRERILNILKEKGQATVGELSHELDLTAVTVRHHMDILRGEGLISEPVVRRRKTPGRPQYVYTLTGKASQFFPKRYANLIYALLDELRATLDQEAINDLVTRIGMRIARQADLPKAHMSFASRVQDVTQFLDDMGYMTSLDTAEEGIYILHIANCPYERATQDELVCQIDQAMLAELFGTSPECLACAAQGEPMCTYRVAQPDDV